MAALTRSGLKNAILEDHKIIFLYNFQLHVVGVRLNYRDAVDKIQQREADNTCRQQSR